MRMASITICVESGSASVEGDGGHPPAQSTPVEAGVKATLTVEMEVSSATGTGEGFGEHSNSGDSGDGDEPESTTIAPLPLFMTPLRQFQRRRRKTYLPKIIGGYKVVGTLSKGTFGLVFRGVQFPPPASGEARQAAIKFEKRAWRPGMKSLLMRECDYYAMLGKDVGFSELLWMGMAVNRYFVMVMELHGPSLDELVKKHYNKLSLKSVLMLGMQLLTKMEIMHCHKIIHRDIKPQNIVIGNGHDCKSVYIIDFGLADQYQGQEESKPDLNHFTGTVKYASLNAQAGTLPMYRDDLESLFYTFVFMLKGSLPWQHCEGITYRDQVTKIRALKKSLSIADICEGLPSEFSEFLTYCRGLEFKAMPDYEYIRKLFRQRFKANNYKWDLQFEWVEAEQPPQEVAMDLTISR